MTKRFITILGKIILCLFAIFAFTECDKDENTLIGDKGEHLHFYHVAPEMAVASCNDYWVKDGSLTIQVFLMSELREEPSYSTPQHHALPADADIEKKISLFLDPKGTLFNGDVPVTVDYTTEECESITISLFDKEDNLLSDETESARFFYENIATNGEQLRNILINSDKEVLGYIPLNATIKEYLSYRPMVFASARFNFPNLKDTALDGDNYMLFEITLTNGTTLLAKATEPQKLD